MNKEIKTEVEFQDLTLVAEVNQDPSYKEIFIGLKDKNGVYIQDLAIVGFQYHYDGDEVVNERAISIKVYADAQNEDYTHSFPVDIFEEHEGIHDEEHKGEK